MLVTIEFSYKKTTKNMYKLLLLRSKDTKQCTTLEFLHIYLIRTLTSIKMESTMFLNVEILSKPLHIVLQFPSTDTHSHVNYFVTLYSSILRPRSHKPTILYRTTLHFSGLLVPSEMLQLHNGRVAPLKRPRSSPQGS